MVTLNLSLNDVRNCKETKFDKGLLLETSKKPYKLKASKPSNNAIKASKTRSGDKIQIVLMMQKYANMILMFRLLEKMLQSNS